MGIQGTALEEPRSLPQMVTALVRGQIQNADPGRPWPARFPTRRERRLPAFHNAPAIEGALKNVVLPGRRPLGAQAPELALVVPDGERLGRPVVRREVGWILSSPPS